MNDDGSNVFCIVVPLELHLLWENIVRLCAKIVQIMCDDFKDYARTLSQLCTHYAHFYRLCIIY